MSVKALMSWSLIGKSYASKKSWTNLTQVNDQQTVKEAWDNKLKILPDNNLK